MKFKRYNKHTALRATGVCTISINPRTGLFSLAQLAVERLGISNDPDQPTPVEVLQDEENPGDWYLAVGTPDGFMARRNSQKSSVVFTSKETAVALLEACKLPTNGLSLKMQIGLPTEVDGLTLYPIITRSVQRWSKTLSRK